MENKKVNIFVCGPTVYDFSHVGHARTYIFFDVFVKYLRRAGYKVFYLQNITDIDDKIIKRAKEENVSWKGLSRKFEKEYFKDVKSLGIDSVNKYARAADYIKEIISQTERLLKNGFAYQISDGIYYDIKKFKDYGKLSKRTALQAEDAVSRIDEGKEKRNKGDFCLWKFYRPDEPRWKSPFGFGRPGWHIEDTAITEKHFGPQYDLHGGAKDLIFPHHEAEIAQMEAISGKKPLVRYWLHTGFLTADNAKMSKSSGNFITIRGFLKNYSARVLRLFILKSLYRSPISYNEKIIRETKKELERIEKFIINLKNQILSFKNASQKSKSNKNLISKSENDFQKAMDDNLNTPKALAVIFDLIKKSNDMSRDKFDSDKARDVYNLFLKFDQVLGLGLNKIKKKKIVVPKEIKELIKKRGKARLEKNWPLADQIRQEIEKKGYKIEDTEKGVKIYE